MHSIVTHDCLSNRKNNKQMFLNMTLCRECGAQFSRSNASPDRNSKTTVTVSFLGVTGIKPGPDLSPNQNALRITSGTEPTLIHKEDTTSLVDISVIPCSCRPRVATTNLSNSCTCGLERLPSARNDTFVDSHLWSYTGDSTPLLQLSDHSYTCEVVQKRPRLKRPPVGGVRKLGGASSGVVLVT
ncbi:uncharacterized protein TNCV_3234431 [Trichonephila clavipes]|nr:uncharacterized protein TNCV_3234431 [Trichonephila clavipes]